MVLSVIPPPSFPISLLHILSLPHSIFTEIPHVLESISHIPYNPPLGDLHLQVPKLLLEVCMRIFPTVNLYCRVCAGLNTSRCPQPPPGVIHKEQVHYYGYSYIPLRHTSSGREGGGIYIFHGRSTLCALSESWFLMVIVGPRPGLIYLCSYNDFNPVAIIAVDIFISFSYILTNDILIIITPKFALLSWGYLCTICLLILRILDNNANRII